MATQTKNGISDERINVRGAINALEVGGAPLVLPKGEDYQVSSVRSTAGSVTGDTGKVFKVSSKGDRITVVRKS